MYCPKCGAFNEDNSAYCISCGQVLPGHTPEAPPIPVNDGTFGGLIPYRNTPALIGYYLAVFSIIPCLGIFLGIAGFILGLMGLRLAREHPECRGVGHSWVAIIVGGLFGFGYLIAALLMGLFAAANS